MKKISALFLFLSISFILIVLVLSAVFGLNPLHFFRETGKNVTLGVIYVALLYAFILITVFAVQKRFDRDGISGLGLDCKEICAADIIKSSCLALGLFMVYAAVIVGTGVATFNNFNSGIIFLVLEGIVFGFLFSFVEEVLFRGFIYGAFCDDFDPIIAAILTNVLFAVSHIFRPGTATFKIVFFIGLFIFGMILSYLYYKTGSLWTPIAVHAVWIACMYLWSADSGKFGSLININPAKFEKLKWLWGFDGTPITGFLGIVVLIAFFLILHFVMDSRKTE